MDYPGDLLALLRQARTASRRERGKGLARRSYTEKEQLLAEAIRKYRGELWIGIDPARPSFYLIVGPKWARRPVTLHFPVEKARSKKLERFIGATDDERERPS